VNTKEKEEEEEEEEEKENQTGGVFLLRGTAAAKVET